MTRARFAFLALTCAALTACGGGQVPPAQNYATIRGRAYDTATNQPVSGVTVTVDTILTGTTAADGTYRITNVPLGSYSLAASASGYAPPQSPQFAGSVSAGETITVDIPLTKS